MNEPSSENPYQATFIDEKPVEMVRFLRAEPVPKKLVKESLGEATVKLANIALLLRRLEPNKIIQNFHYRSKLHIN